MVPLRLTVKNFMCYRDEVPSLDLEGIHVACLCGDNGHGKTALLDSITWALWGQARARTQEELVHQGRQDMSVELEFMARDQRYRVSRRYSRSPRSRGATILELQVSSGDGFRAITGDSVRQTEARIRDVLHMDYETFVNTAFLLQGNADRFTTSKPTKRKEVLAEVLDLSYYGSLEERAKGRSRDLEDETRTAQGAIDLRLPEIARRTEHERMLTSVEANLHRLGPEVDSRRQLVKEAQSRLGALNGKQLEIESLDRRLADSRGVIDDLEARARDLQARIDDYEAMVANDSEIRQQFARLEEAKAELEHLDRASLDAARLDRERAPLKEAIAVERQRLASRADQLGQVIKAELEPTANRLPEIQEGLLLNALEEERLAVLGETITERRTEAEDTDRRLGYLRQANEELRQEMEDTRKKFDMLELDGAECPLCMQPLGPEGQEHLRREYKTQGLDRKRRHEANSEEQDRLRKKHEELTGLVERLEADRDKGQRQLQTTIAILQRGLEEAQKARDELQPATASFESVETDLNAGNFAHDEREKLARLDGELSALAYDPDAHRRVQERARELEPSAELNRRLAEARDALPREREALEAVQQMLNRRRKDIASDEARRKTLARELETLPGIESEMAEAQSALGELEKQERDAKVDERDLIRQLEKIAALEEEVRRLEKDRGDLVGQKSIYDELTVAFGKNGIQALIIEAAIPQLNDDANELLGRLTENRMFLKLQLQEGQRMGQPSEKLDIKISDEVGTRSYETFSGGEAFRINFALRIALSKLLARRSGAPLPILFIDEGFGSQDAAGQERLKEAIQSIQSDFEKIIVITHVEQVKESFPTRIEVTKTPNGSTFVVV